ncbi:MAG: TRAP transporter small permease subunit [Spirochaetales bacterium]|jgi:TRAP-type C4-dicarboxylate transport system permease small subunit|nr:TRAP transporter small permease subunit [Spirochaetales bacterium]
MTFFRTIYCVLNKGSNTISRILGILLTLLVVACACSVILQVFNRYVIVKISDFSFSFTDELSRLLMVNITYIAIALCLREGSMAQVDLIFSRLNKAGRFFLYFVTRILVAVVLFISIYYGYRVMTLKAAFISSMLSVPGLVLYSPPVIGAVLMSYEWLTEILGVLCGELQPFYAGEKRGFPEHAEQPETVNQS